MFEGALHVLLAGAVVGAVGCGSDPRAPALSDTLGSGAGGSSADAAPSECAPGSELIYALSQADDLYRFDPPSLSFAKVGHVACPGTAGTRPHSMAVSRTGEAWIVYADGHLFRVRTSDASCEPTSFAVGQSGFTTFGMGFAADAAGSDDETLFLSENDSSNPLTSKGLASLDTSTLHLSYIGAYGALGSAAELTGTGDGRLFGMFFGPTWTVAEIERGTAAILSQAPQPGVGSPGNKGTFAFAFWGGAFFIFVSDGGVTNVYEYDPANGTTTLVTTAPSIAVTGAGVSTCAPTVHPG